MSPSSALFFRFLIPGVVAVALSGLRLPASQALQLFFVLLLVLCPESFL
jgi:hypothetical protein